MTIDVQNSSTRGNFVGRAGDMLRILVAVTFAAAPLSAQAGVTFTNIFYFNGTNGDTPCGTLIQARDGNLYGVCQSGGPYDMAPSYGGYGGVFRISLAGSFTNLAWFDGTNAAEVNQGLVEGPDGNLYGTALEGGLSGDYNSPGTVYKVTPQGVVSVLANFVGTNGAVPKCALVLAPDGNFYGTTQGGGTHPLFSGDYSPACGTIFRITPGGMLTTLVDLVNTNSLGYVPEGGLLLGGDGFLYGKTAFGGNITNGYGEGQGTAFKMSLQGDISFFASFDLTNANGVLWPLIQGADGSFYGTSMYGGVNYFNYGYNLGNCFRVSPDGAVSNLFSFSATNGCLPRGILQCSDGNFYGVSGYGGIGATPANPTGEPGNIFRLSPDGKLTVLFSFDGPNGAQPFCGLMQASDGNLYGTTRGDNGHVGTIFRLSVPLPAAFKNITQTNNTVALTWSAVASQTYQVQYRTSAGQGGWTNFGAPITATDGTMTTIDTIGADTQRLYRVALIP